jgi:hypothetical protein
MANSDFFTAVGILSRSVWECIHQKIKVLARSLLGASL